jgi:rhamnose transport system substrate-binding protein
MSKPIRSTYRNLPLLVALALVAAACGTVGETSVTETTPAPAPTEASDTTPDTETTEAAPDTTTGGEGEGSIIIVVIPKQTGDPFFVAVDEGAQEAAAELGYEIRFLGPPAADAAGQVTAIEQAIQLDPVAITIAANDPDAVVPALEAAAEAGILVSSYNADVRQDARDFYVNQADPDAIARTVIEEMIDALGGETAGEFLVVTSVLTAPNQNEWIALMEEQLTADYPDMTIAEIIPGNDDQQTVQQVTRTYLQANPNTTGVWVMGGGMPGAVLAMQQLGIDPLEVPVTGLCIPSVVREFLKEGLINDCSLWNPADLGYAAVYTIDAQIAGEVPFGEEGVVEGGRLGEMPFVDDTVTIGDPFIFTPDNVDDFDF